MYYKDEPKEHILFKKKKGRKTEKTSNNNNAACTQASKHSISGQLVEVSLSRLMACC
jgi:hypothetical protein